MKKKNIGFILFGVAGVNLISAIIFIIVFPALYKDLKLPLDLQEIIFRVTLIFDIISMSILIIIGLILIIKFRND